MSNSAYKKGGVKTAVFQRKPPACSQHLPTTAAAPDALGGEGRPASLSLRGAGPLL